MKQKRCTFFLCFLFLSLVSNAFSSIKGSETVLSVEPYYTFPSADNDNAMLGFGWFKNGFALEDSSTSCTFDSIFPVSGDVYLNGGDLHLSKDIAFENVTTWYTPGTIHGNDYVIDLCCSVTEIGSPVYKQIFDSTHLHLDNDLVVSGTIRFKGNSLVNGNNSSIILKEGGYLLVDAGATVTFKDVYIENLSEGQIACLDDSSRIIFDNVTCMLDEDFSFNTGSFAVHNNLDVTGPYVFTYENSRTSTIYKNSELHLYGGITFAFGRKGSVEPLYLEDDSSSLRLDNCTLSAGSEGVCFTRGVFLFHHEVCVNLGSTGSTDGVVFGDGTAAGDSDIIIEAGASVYFEKGHLVYNQSQPNNLFSRGVGSRLIRSGGTGFFVNQDILLSEFHIVDKNYEAATIVADGKSVSYSDVIFEWPNVTIELTAERQNLFTNLLAGDQELCLLRGILPSYVTIQNSGNLIYGNGALSGQIILQDSDAELQLNLQGSLLQSVVLNGGTAILLDDLSFTKKYMFLGEGKVDLDTHSVNLGSMDSRWTGTIYWDGVEGHLHLNSNVSLAGTWTFSGVCIIHGGNNILALEEGAEIVVEKGSQLMLREVKIQDLAGNNIRCLGQNSSIVYDDCKARMSANYSFTQGSFHVNELFELHGDYTFAYRSAQQSVINPCSILRMTEGTTLSYDPLVPLRDRLAFYNDKSILELDYATLHSTATGWMIMKGIVELEGDVIMSSDATCKEEGIFLGDGVSSANNCTLEVLANADLDIGPGYVVDKNVS